MAGFYYGDDWQREMEQRRLDHIQREADAKMRARAIDLSLSPEDRAEALEAVRRLGG